MNWLAIRRFLVAVLVLVLVYVQGYLMGHAIASIQTERAVAALKECQARGHQ